MKTKDEIKKELEITEIELSLMTQKFKEKEMSNLRVDMREQHLIYSQICRLDSKVDTLKWLLNVTE